MQLPAAQLCMRLNVFHVHAVQWLSRGQKPLYALDSWAVSHLCGGAAWALTISRMSSGVLSPSPCLACSGS